MVAQEEIWKPVLDFEGSYAVSSLGQIKSLRRTKKGPWRQVRVVPERILKQHIPHSGTHLVVGLCRNGVTTVCRVDHLVLQSFVGPRPPGMAAKHLDGNATD